MPATPGIEDGVLKVLERGTEDEDYGLHLGLMKVKLPGWAIGNVGAGNKGSHGGFADQIAWYLVSWESKVPPPKLPPPKK